MRACGYRFVLFWLCAVSAARAAPKWARLIFPFFASAFSCGVPGCDVFGGEANFIHSIVRVLGEFFRPGLRVEDRGDFRGFMTVLGIFRSGFRWLGWPFLRVARCWLLPGGCRFGVGMWEFWATARYGRRNARPFC